MHTLGSGNFGKVYLVEERASKEQFAAKIVDKKIFKAGDQKLHAEKEQKICEIFSKRLSHKHIVKIHEVFTEQDLIYIIMDYVEGGELFHRIREKKKLPENEARTWFREIMEAVDYIHENNIVHRDLKPENGNPFYAAPEMVTATPYQGPPADVWSCGVILYAMLTGFLPFQADQMPELFRKIKAGEYRPPPGVSVIAADLIRKLLCVDARKRMTTKECLSHPWLLIPPKKNENPSPYSSLANSFATYPQVKNKYSSSDLSSPSTEVT
ncbi:hypothetical protein G6F35_011043 [Rhizopus arrhizus]|nr:hypothetical protein G6F35_011043 [Rhizopus arrhizus]